MALFQPRRSPRLPNPNMDGPKMPITGASSVSSSSPLLSLPSEIRNQIYSYVLGGNELHVCVTLTTQNVRIKNRKLEVFICTADLDEASAASTVRRHVEHDFDDLSDWYHRHEQCGIDSYRNTPSPRSPIFFQGIALLETCKQIHSEAALIPFQTNTFIFDSKNAFHTFCKKLVPLQLKAVTSVSVEAGHFYHFEEKLTTVRAITALTQLTIFHPMPKPFNPFLDQQIQKRDLGNLNTWLSPFKSLKLSSVRICFYPEVPDTRRHRDGRRYTLEPTFAVTERMRANIARYQGVCEAIEDSLLEKGRDEREDGDGVKT